MSAQEILNSNLNKTQKAYKLYSLGQTRHDVARLLTNGNYGFAHNIWVKWNANNFAIVPTIERTTIPFDFNFNRTFGIELEIYDANRETLIREFTRVGIVIESQSYNHRTSNNWKIVSDSSIVGSNGNEIVSPILKGLDGFEQIKKVCLALSRAGAKINNSCGFHVHFGARDMNIDNFKTLIKSYAKLENSFDAIVPKSRRGNSNSFCKNLTSVANLSSKIERANTIQELASRVFNGGRYFKLNIQSFERHGTVEFRQHSGTTTYSKIRNWVLICGRLVDYCNSVGMTDSFNDFLNESLTDYVSDRIVDLAV